MQKITRTVCTTMITAQKVVLTDGDPTLSDVLSMTVQNVKVKDEKAALKLLKKEFGDGVYTKIQINSTEQVYGLDFEVFMQYAEPVYRPASQQKKTEE